MATTYEAIATATLSSPAASITFSSIPQTFTDLILKISARSSAAGTNWTFIGINGGSDSESTLLHVLNFGGSIYGQTYSSLRTPITNTSLTANTFSNNEIYFSDYTGATKKTISGDGVQESNTADYELQAAVYEWPYSAAITQLVLTTDGAVNFATNSSATLYGVKKS